jgi:hypothetical protein
LINDIEDGVTGVVVVLEDDVVVVVEEDTGCVESTVGGFVVAC